MAKEFEDKLLDAWRRDEEESQQKEKEVCYCSFQRANELYNFEHFLLTGRIFPPIKSKIYFL